NAHCTIPDDPDQSTYRFIIVAAKRARQLQGGARPVLPTSSKKPTVIAMEETRRGLVKCSPKPFCKAMKILLCVGGFIAADKAAETARQLIQGWHQVQAAMTAAARE